MIVKQTANTLAGGEHPHAPSLYQLGMPDAHTHEITVDQEQPSPGSAVLGEFFR